MPPFKWQCKKASSVKIPLDRAIWITEINYTSANILQTIDLQVLKNIKIYRYINTRDTCQITFRSVGTFKDEGFEDLGQTVVRLPYQECYGLLWTIIIYGAYSTTCMHILLHILLLYGDDSGTTQNGRGRLKAIRDRCQERLFCLEIFEWEQWFFGFYFKRQHLEINTEVVM